MSKGKMEQKRVAIGKALAQGGTMSIKDLARKLKVEHESELLQPLMSPWFARCTKGVHLSTAGRHAIKELQAAK